MCRGLTFLSASARQATETMVRTTRTTRDSCSNRNKMYFWFSTSLVPSIEYKEPFCFVDSKHLSLALDLTRYHCGAVRKGDCHQGTLRVGGPEAHSSKLYPAGHHGVLGCASAMVAIIPPKALPQTVNRAQLTLKKGRLLKLLFHHPTRVCTQGYKDTGTVT